MDGTPPPFNVTSSVCTISDRVGVGVNCLLWSNKQALNQEVSAPAGVWVWKPARATVVWILERDWRFLSMEKMSSQNSEQKSCQEVSTETKILQSVISYEQHFSHQSSNWCFFLHKNPNRPFIHMKYASDDYFNHLRHACSTPADHLMAVQSRTCKHSWPTHTHTHFNTFTSAAPDTWAFTTLRCTSATNVESNGRLFRPLSLSTAPTSDGIRAAAERVGSEDGGMRAWWSERCVGGFEKQRGTMLHSARRQGWGL